MLLEAVGDSPMPSSRSRDVPQIEPKSPSPVVPDPEELDEAELQPELPLRAEG